MTWRILVIDDNEDLLSLLAAALADEGYDAVTCNRAREAYSVARARHPDVVLLDIMMPGMNGWEVLNLFLLDPTLRTVPVVLMTAAAADARRKLARLDITNLSILSKPFGIDHLVAAIEEALGKPAECEELYDKIISLVTPLAETENGGK